MTEAEALSEAVEASMGFPIPTPAEFAQRLIEQLRLRGFVLTDQRDQLAYDLPGHDQCCSKLQALCPQPVDNPVEGS